MGNDRILLMNDDTKLLAAVTSQGYDATNTTSKTFWVHTGPKPVNMKPLKYLLAGTNHVMYANDGTKYWELENCRAGSASVIAATRNYIPWSKTTKAITAPYAANIPMTDDGAGSVGSVVMRNAEDACIYSPYYEEGIGTIYFDAVNSFVNDTSTRLVLEIATEVKASAYAEGVRFTSSLDDYGVMDWRVCPFELFTVANAALSKIESAATNVVLSSTASGDGLFYRMRSTLNYCGPIRFRIRRVNKAAGAIDTAGLILVDNIIASYPPMRAELNRYGTDYDESLKGSEVLGCGGDFTVPFLAYQGEGAQAHVFVSFYTNTASKLAAKINNPRLVYRWRYLNQIVGDWKSQPFDRQREALLRIEQLVRDIVGPDPLFLRNVEDNELELRLRLNQRFFLLAWMLKASPEEYERMRVVNQLLFDKTVQLKEAMVRTCKRLREMPKDDFVNDIEVHGKLFFCFDDEQSALPMECDVDYGSDYELMMSVHYSLQRRDPFDGEGLEIWCRYDQDDTIFELDDGGSWGHEFGPAPHFEGICICHTAGAFVSQLRYPVFDLLRMNEFWTEIHVVFQNFDYIKKHMDL